MSLVTRHSVETPNFAESFLNTLKSRAKDGDSAHLDMSTVISHRKTVSTALKDLEPSFTKALSNFTSDIGLESGGAINFKWTDTIKSHPELHKAFVAFRNVSDDVDDTLSALTFPRDTTQKPTKEERDLLDALSTETIKFVFNGYAIEVQISEPHLNGRKNFRGLEQFS